MVCSWLSAAWVLGDLALVSESLYGTLGLTAANIVVGRVSSVIGNVPVMCTVLQMSRRCGAGQWLLVTLTAGVGGSLLSIRSAAGVALMGARYSPVSCETWKQLAA